jgi:hypothetical protein
LVTVNKGDWIGCFIPTPRYYIDSFDLINAKDYLTEEVKEQVAYGLYRFDAQDVTFTRVDIEGL